MSPMESVEPAHLASRRNTFGTVAKRQRRDERRNDHADAVACFDKDGFIFVQDRVGDGHRENFDMAVAGDLDGISEPRFFNVKRDGFAQAETEEGKTVLLFIREFFEVENRHADGVIGNDKGGGQAARSS